MVSKNRQNAAKSSRLVHINPLFQVNIINEFMITDGTVRHYYCRICKSCKIKRLQWLAFHWQLAIMEPDTFLIVDNPRR